MTQDANRREFALRVLRGLIEDARIELSEHQAHVAACERRLETLLISQEAVQASKLTETTCDETAN